MSTDEDFLSSGVVDDLTPPAIDRVPEAEIAELESWLATDTWFDADPSLPPTPTADPRIMLVRPMPRRAMAARRAFDLCIAIPLLLVFAPVMLLIAVLVRTTSRGPALFRQERVGRGGETFEVLKFRSMRQGAADEVYADRSQLEQYIANDFKLPDGDARITKVGRVIRKTSLDELPQLWNVVRGEMSIVGIRPIEPLQLALRPQYDQLLYCLMQPGLTGLWQVSGRSSVTPERRLELDRTYVTSWSVGRDLGIVLRTPLAMVAGDTK